MMIIIMHTIRIIMIMMWMRRGEDQGGLALGCRGNLEMIVMINILILIIVSVDLRNLTVL